MGDSVSDDSPVQPVDDPSYEARRKLLGRGELAASGGPMQRDLCGG